MFKIVYRDLENALVEDEFDREDDASQLIDSLQEEEVEYEVYEWVDGAWKYLYCWEVVGN